MSMPIQKRRGGLNLFFLHTIVLPVLFVFHVTEAPAAFSSAPYFPLKSGSFWTYLIDGSTSGTNTVLPGTTLINGVATTVVKSTESGFDFFQYFTNDGNGIRLHAYSDADVGLFKFSPPIKIANANTDSGQTVNTTGMIQTSFGNIAYSSSFTVQAFEIITVPLRAFDVLRVDGSLSIPGVPTAFTTEYLARNVGIVKEVGSLAGDTSTLELTATNVKGLVDFSGNGISDIVVNRGGAWLFHNFTTGAQTSGVWTGSAPGCIAAPMDYTGDGKVKPTQFCGGAWHFYNANGSYNKGIWVGNVAGDRPVPADYDGDGKDDVVVYRSGAWLFFDFATGAFNAAKSRWTGGGGSCIPVPMDYDGDGTANFTQLCNGSWHFYNANGSYNKGIWTGGVAGDKPVPADYDGNGTEKVVVFRNGAWLFFDFATGLFNAAKSVWTGAPPHWTGGTSLPAPIDYNGDGKVDFTVYSGGPWYFYNANGSYNKGIWTGRVVGDRPISARLLP